MERKEGVAVRMTERKDGELVRRMEKEREVVRRRKEGVVRKWMERNKG